jgi:hypothetical protein
MMPHRCLFHPLEYLRPNKVEKKHEVHDGHHRRLALMEPKDAVAAIAHGEECCRQRKRPAPATLPEQADGGSGERHAQQHYERWKMMRKHPERSNARLRQHPQRNDSHARQRQICGSPRCWSLGHGFGVISCAGRRTDLPYPARSIHYALRASCYGRQESPRAPARHWPELHSADTAV